MTMKQIALFGGSGKTGRQFLQQALDKGYRIKALVRNPAALSISHPFLEVIKGDVLRLEDVDKTVAGTAVVVSLFGHVKDSPANLQTEGTQNIIIAMKRHGAQRIISLSGGGLPYEKDQPKFADKLIRGIMQLVAKKMLDDAINHAALLKQSGLQWTIVRGPRLTNAPGTGRYNVGWVGVPGGTQISREDLAKFIVSLLEQDKYIGEMPFVTKA